MIFLLVLNGCNYEEQPASKRDHFVSGLLSRMNLEEKVGQLSQFQSPGKISKGLRDDIRSGRVGSIINEVGPELINEMQRIAVEDSPSGIPILFARDVIHGFRTIFPVNIGMAASFNPGLVSDAYHIAGQEAYSRGIRWTFAPMVDISRDPRWGRMAEGFGEDTYLVTRMALASQDGFQRKELGSTGSLATCVKHFVGYGAVEGGRDYNTVSIPAIELFNTYFPPFKALAKNGVNTFMTSFTEVNGVPATGNEFLLKSILREKWGFDGVVVSDWESVSNMIVHGFASDSEDAAFKAFAAGVDMEMTSQTYLDQLPGLLEEGRVTMEQVDASVRRVLELKYDLGLFSNPYVDIDEVAEDVPPPHLDIARSLSAQSLVLLQNNNNTLPISQDIRKLAVIGPMANDRYEQLGTWIFDGDTNLTVTPLSAIRDLVGSHRVDFEPGLRTTRDLRENRFAQATTIARRADAVVFFAGEESILTGEAHCRSELSLPGAQEQLIRRLSDTGTPIILVIMTPRPLALGPYKDLVDAILYAWHPGTMGGAAIADVLFGIESPSGKLPVTFPKNVGQIPIYYNHKNTGNPPSDQSWIRIEDIPKREFQTSLGNTSHYLDIGFLPEYPFGFGLSYTTFEYTDISTSSSIIHPGDSIEISVTLTNAGSVVAEEVSQLYVRDPIASITRPVRELKGFQRNRLKPGESLRLSFWLSTSDLTFYDSEYSEVLEEGGFKAWIGGSSEADLGCTFTLKATADESI